MAPHGNRRAPVVAPVAFGVAELRPDTARPHGWTVYVDGVEQSYVDQADPRHLAFPYVRRLAAVLDTAAPNGVPLAVLHLGGGGLTLPRYVAASRPGSAQRVVERDAALLALVTRTLPLPAGVSVQVADARHAVDQGGGDAPAGGYDAIVVDVFDGARMPDSVAGVGFAAAVARLLRPGGVLGVNLTDLPPLAHSRIQAATLRTVFGDVGLIAEPGMVRGRRAGNVVLVAGHMAGDLPVRRLTAALRRAGDPGRLMRGPELAAFLAGARARLETPN